MPRNSSGVYTLPGGNPVTPGDVIEAEWANTTLEDVANELTNSLSRTGAGGMLAPFRIADGNVSGPGLSYLNETNTGLYRSGSGSTWMSVLGVNTAQFSTVGLTIPSGKALTAVGNASVGGTFSVGGAATFSSTLALTGALTATGGVVGNVTGNVTAGSGTSTFNDVVITGALDMTAGSSATITGLSNPTNPSDAANKAYVDTQDALHLALTGGTMSGAIAMGNSKVTGLATPTADQDAATKAYVDSVAQGLDVKGSCRAATVANITLSGAQTIDGVAVIAGDRVLVKDQSTAANNGIYVVAAGSWTRSTDADTWAELVGAFTFVEDGTVNDNTGWVCTSAPGGTLGVTAVVFEQFSGAGQVIAGTGMSKTGNTLNVNTASSSRIVVGSDEIDLATTGVTASTYKSVTVDQWGRVTAGTNPTTLTGFGITDAYTQAQVDAALALKLNLTGGTMSGAIAMGTNKITGLGDPTLAQDAATKNYIDTIFGSTTTAAASAAAAAASASAASSSASSASGSASAAASSASAAAASYDSFDDRYLGAKASDPTTDNDGNPLLTGALYWNTTSNAMKVYDGSAWVAAYLPTAGFAQLGAANVFTANQTITDNSSNAALKITQTGSGNALYIEDVAADATPFVVSSTGAVGIGTTTPDNVTSAGIALVSNNGYYPQVVNRNKTNDANASYMVFDKDRAGAIVQSGDNLGNIVWRSFDGANYLQSAAIIGYSDGAPGTNDVPGALSFLTTADGASAPTERVRIASTGAVAFNGSYGTSGQVLTSGGSGAAPTWAAPPASAGTVTAVASGTLPNGATVIVNSDGTVSVPVASGSNSLTNVAASALNGTTAYAINANARTVSACYNSRDDTIAFFYIGVTNSYLYCIPGKIVGSTISWGTSTVVNSSLSIASGSNYGISAAYDYQNNQFFCLFRQNYNGYGGYTYCKFNSNLSFLSYGSSENAWANSDPTIYPMGYSLIISPTLNGSYTQGLIIWKSNGSSQTFVNGVSCSNNTMSIGSQTFVINSNANYQMIPTFCDTPAKALIGYLHPSGYPTVAVVSLNGTSATVNTAVQLSTDNGNNYPIAVGYSPTQNKYFVGWGTGSGVKGCVLTLSGTTPSAGTVAAITGFSPGSGDYLYNCVSYATTGDLWFQVENYVQRITISGTTFSVTGSPIYFNYASYPAYPGNMFFDSANNTLVMPSSSGGSPYYPQLSFAAAYSTTLTANNFIGFSSASYTNGQTATINTVGSSNSSQSGLTAGTGYYVTPSGSLSSSSTANYAGVALSATKILVKG
jgi:hypothetical protein